MIENTTGDFYKLKDTFCGNTFLKSVEEGDSYYLAVKKAFGDNYVQRKREVKFREKRKLIHEIMNEKNKNQLSFEDILKNNPEEYDDDDSDYSDIDK